MLAQIAQRDHGLCEDCAIPPNHPSYTDPTVPRPPEPPEHPYGTWQAVHISSIPDEELPLQITKPVADNQTSISKPLDVPENLMTLCEYHFRRRQYPGIKNPSMSPNARYFGITQTHTDKYSDPTYDHQNPPRRILISFQIDFDQHLEIKALALEDGLTASGFYRKIIRNALRAVRSEQQHSGE